MPEQDTHLAQAKLIDLSTIQSLLKTRRLGKAPGWTNELWDIIDSTNTRASELAELGAADGVMVLARQQKAGRGRHGRQWLSQTDAGIYLSFLLRPKIETIHLPLHTIAAGIACVEAIQDCAGISIGLKWVNDLIFDSKKIGGILAEIISIYKNDTATKILPQPLVLGIGINLRLSQEQIPEELLNRINCLDNITNSPIDPNLLIATLALRLESALDLLEQGNHESLLNKWRQYSITLGKTIKTFSRNTEIIGQAIDIDESGGLIIETADKQHITLHAGEISIRNADGNYA